MDSWVLRESNRLGGEQQPGTLARLRAEAEWGCPKCRQLYKQAAIPHSYTCFCGKQPDPEFDPWIAPHTCGEVCGKGLAGSCGHSCLLLCHPGPCPPCPLVVDAVCSCGKSRRRRRCGQQRFQCG